MWQHRLNAHSTLPLYSADKAVLTTIVGWWLNRTESDSKTISSKTPSPWQPPPPNTGTLYSSMWWALGLPFIIFPHIAHTCAGKLYLCWTDWGLQANQQVTTGTSWWNNNRIRKAAHFSCLQANSFFLCGWTTSSPQHHPSPHHALPVSGSCAPHQRRCPAGTPWGRARGRTRGRPRPCCGRTAPRWCSPGTGTRARAGGAAPLIGSRRWTTPWRRAIACCTRSGRRGPAGTAGTWSASSAAPGNSQS